MFKIIAAAFIGASVGSIITLFFMALLLAAKDGKNNEEAKKRGKWLKFSLGSNDFVDRFHCSVC